MQKYFSYVQTDKGLAVVNALVTVTTYPGGINAAIYSDDGVTPAANPITTTSLGFFQFYAADGHYSLTISGNGIVTTTVQDILIVDDGSTGNLTFNTLTLTTSEAITGTTNSTSTTTGAMVTAGGLGVAKAAWIGGLLNVAGATTLQGALSVTGAVTLANTLTITGVVTLTAQPILSTLTASQAVFSDASKGLVSNAITGTGNVVMSTSPTLIGTINAASQTLSGSLSIGTTLGVTGNTTLTGALVGNLITDSTSISTGAIKTAGGLGVTKALWVGGLANIAGAVTLQSTLDTTGAVTLQSTLSATGAATILSGTAIPAGGTAGSGVKLSSTSNFGIFFGSSAPTLAAAKGSLYLRSDGSTTNDRMYVNTNGSTAWTAVTTSA
jgi:hypothetical protein